MGRGASLGPVLRSVQSAVAWIVESSAVRESESTGCRRNQRLRHRRDPGAAVDPEHEVRQRRRPRSSIGECLQPIRFDLGTLQIHRAAGAEPRHHVPCGRDVGASLPELCEQPPVGAVPLALRHEAALVP